MNTLSRKNIPSYCGSTAGLVTTPPGLFADKLIKPGAGGPSPEWSLSHRHGKDLPTAFSRARTVDVPPLNCVLTQPCPDVPGFPTFAVLSINKLSWMVITMFQ